MIYYNICKSCILLNYIMAPKISTKKWYKTIFIVFLLCTFLIGFMIMLSPNVTKEKIFAFLRGEKSLEGFNTESGETSDSNCPDLLIKQGNQLMLVHSKLPKSDKNPLYFDTLTDYTSYVEIQRKQGLRCPILFLQEENNTQGETVYRMRPSPVDMNGGNQIVPTQVQGPSEPVRIVDSSRSGNVFNKDMYPGFDSHGTYIGVYTTLDEIHDMTSSGKLSDNPMDTNWGGVLHSQRAVESGKYDDRIVGKPKMVPKVLA